MLLHTFQHIKGISAKKESTFWQSGVATWDDFESLENKQLSLFKSDNTAKQSPLLLSRKALEKEDADFFANLLPNQEYYRIALTYPERTLFLDIETTGLSKYYDTITLVGWSLGNKYGVLIKGDSDTALREAILSAKAIVTFNGSLFDLPFLRKEFQDLAIPLCHIDLRFFSKRVGLSGGQKEIEQILCIRRPKNVSDIRGETAALLWYKYRWGEVSALKQLILYNHADIAGMKVIFDKVVERIFEKKGVSFRVHRFAKDHSKVKWSGSTAGSTDGVRLRPYKGKTGPAILLKDLIYEPEMVNLRIVGIDLTGSESRPSGWCLLEGNHAITKRIDTDAELIRETIESHPTVVSIDSPLSLPSGRLSVDDFDPGRDEYGIMRYCERILKKRGINVYPSLIPSMQKLTARGIRLANHFRSLGIAVIESYPGAAQDIMGIPRKGLSQEFLATGLKKFGVKGNFINNAVSHDELDAITSAVVGFFFWSGKFEALGNIEEEYLIIPDLNADTKLWRNQRIIGLSGPIAAGKTTAGNYLKSKGFYYGRFSLVLEQLLKERGIESSRKTLQQIGEEINKKPGGQRWLCRRLNQLLPKTGNRVIDGLRHPEDHAFLVETFGPAFFHIHVDVPQDIRLERYVSNGYNKAEFKKAISHPVEANVAKLAQLAHTAIDNSKSKKTFISKLRTAIDKSKIKGGLSACL